MLRGLVLALLLANLAFFTWSQGWLDSVVGIRAGGDREPERLARQVRPESVVILTPVAVAAVASAAEASLACLEAGPFSGAELASAEAALSGVVPAGAWARVPADKPGSWAVYMGRFASSDAQLKKEEELKRLRLTFEELKPSPELPADLTPGLSLGRFSVRDAADAALVRFSQGGVRSARVVELQKPSTTVLLRVAKAEPVLAARLKNLKPEAVGKPFGNCASLP